MDGNARLAVHKRRGEARMSQRPKFGKIPRATEYSGISRSGLYNHAAERPGLFVKDGASTLVNFDVLDNILDGLPKAVIKPPKANRPE
jgi:hypothetical protein